MTRRTRIYLIRHGEVVGAGTPRYNGHADVSLTEFGVSQYYRLQERLADRNITACYSSDLSRCAVGARIIGGHYGLAPVFEPSLRELNIGIWEGLTWEEIKARYPAEWQARLNDIVNFRVPEGENLLDLQQRAMPVMNRIVAAHRGEEVLVVGHGGINRVILLAAVDAPLSSMFSLEQSYAALNIIDYYEDGKTVVTLMNG